MSIGLFLMLMAKKESVFTQSIMSGLGVGLS